MKHECKILHYPVLSSADFVFFRLFGPGFGNLLFPLYRAFQSQKKIGGKLVFPQFFQIKIGPFFRMEKDKRTYIDLFKFRNFNDLKLHIRALFSMSVNEDLVGRPLFQLDKVKVIKYEGLRNYFKDLELQYLSEFNDYLLGRANHVMRLRRELMQISKDDICVHLRRGDFAAEATKEAAASGKMNYRLSDDWYVAAVSLARNRNPHARVRVFSDAPNLDPELLARLKCDEVDQSINGLHAMMKMAAHGVLIASKSSFSLWSAYLGQQYVYLSNDFDLESYMPGDLLRFERV